MKLVSRLGPQRCVYCHGGLGEEKTKQCSECATQHHQDCFDQHGCAVFGCTSQRIADERPYRVCSDLVAHRLAREDRVQVPFVRLDSQMFIKQLMFICLSFLLIVMGGDLGRFTGNVALIYNMFFLIQDVRRKRSLLLNQ